MSANPYDTLGVGSDASGDDIRSAYRVMAKRHHPDARGGDAAAFKAVNEAYGLLIDPSRRSVFDRETARSAHAASVVDISVEPGYDPYAATRSTPRSPVEPTVEHQWSPFAAVDRLSRSFGIFGGPGFRRAYRPITHDTADFDVYLSRDEAATGATATIDVGFGTATLAIPPGIPDGVRLCALVRRERLCQRVTFHVHVAGE